MLQYRLSQKLPHDPFLQVEIIVPAPLADFKMKLPEWRPGRYQLGGFSKYLRNFRVYNAKGETLNFQKTDKNTWQIHAQDESCIIRYEIYTSVIDGGSTFVDEEHWYLNFINCMLYVAAHLEQPHQVELDIPAHWKLASGLKSEGNVLFADSFYELVDSPALAGYELQHLEYKVQETNFHLWFRGKADLSNKEKIISDFKKFTVLQMETMKEFENKDYHFLFQIPDEKAYHGVEHLNSTCIVLGPAKDFNTESFYNNFLGISSHELFHYWNIIRIRPKEMWPYDFERENYFPTGYVAEGITTYYGDLFLVRSGVKDINWYLNELNILFKRHFENYGRFNTSVAESSWDLWLDGYEAGIPHRKVSIYVKGALIALILDLRIIEETEGERCLDDLMRKLWTDFYKKSRGYSSEDYLNAAEEIIGHNLKDYAQLYIDGCEPLENELMPLLNRFGFNIESKPNENVFTHHFGFKSTDGKIVDIAPNSPAENFFRIGDEIISFENQRFEEIDQHGFPIAEHKQYNFELFRGNKQKKFKVDLNEDKFFGRYDVTQKEKISSRELNLRKKWLHL